MLYVILMKMYSQDPVLLDTEHHNEGDGKKFSTLQDRALRLYFSKALIFKLMRNPAEILHVLECFAELGPICTLLYIC